MQAGHADVEEGELWKTLQTEQRANRGEAEVEKRSPRWASEASGTPSSHGRRAPRLVGTLVRGGGDSARRLSPRPTPPSPGERDLLLPLRCETFENMEMQQFLSPCENVYSFHMFVVPVERRRGAGITVVSLALFLVVLNLLMQFWLLTMVSQFVLHKNADLFDSLVHRDGPELPWYRAHEGLAHLWASSDADSSTTCRDSASLCFNEGDGITCAPPSIQVLKQWHVLDLDGDGFWSRSEALREDVRQEILCKHNVDLTVLFDDLVNDIQDHAGLQGRLHPNLTKGMGIHKAYFDWFIGEPMLCQYGDQDMCGSLFERGLFDGALLPGNAFPASERGIDDVQAARDYCAQLLTHRCDTLLPSTYRVWKVSSVDKCGSKDFTPIFYTPPDGSMGQWMLRVTFSEEEAYIHASSWKFTCYLGVLLFVFLAVMVEEAKGIHMAYMWIFKSQVIDGERAELSHLATVFVVNTVRCLLFVILFYSGIVFLSEDTDILNLIFDALSLVFIIQIDELLYSTLLRKQMKGYHMDIPWVEFRRTPYRHISIVAAECVRVGVLTACALLISYLHKVQTVAPVRRALQCLCTVEGEKCYEVTAFNKAWWDNYWSVTLPEAAQAIDSMMVLARVSGRL